MKIISIISLVGNEKLKHTIYQNKCMHLHPELAPLTEKNKEPEPCCLFCKVENCSAICNIAKKRREEGCEEENIQYNYQDIKYCLEQYEISLKTQEELEWSREMIKERKILVDALRLLIKQWEGEDEEKTL